MRGLFFIGNGCKKLIELDLYRSIGLTDKGISAVARRCTDLEMINSSYSVSITDSSLISLSNCCELNTLESRGCPLITSSGLKSIAIREFVSRVWCIKIVSPQEVQQLGKQGVKVLDPVQIQKPSDSCYTPSQQVYELEQWGRISGFA
ncbi:putative leucine-rich repeat domain superfamily [Helianthus annuus]|nr:putative leucine-rich repeat domain superfamily [Helianthus annuus]